MGQADRIKTAKRRRYALRCRQQGATYEEVAQACIEKWGKERLPKGYDHRYAWKDIHRELEKARKEVEEEAETTLKLELRRLDEMQSRLYPVALGDEDTPPDPRAVDRILRIMKRRADLLGIDEPGQIEHSGPEGGAIEHSHEIDFSKLTDEQVERLAAGEPPEDVL